MSPVFDLWSADVSHVVISQNRLTQCYLTFEFMSMRKVQFVNIMNMQHTQHRWSFFVKATATSDDYDLLSTILLFTFAVNWLLKCFILSKIPKILKVHYVSLKSNIILQYSPIFLNCRTSNCATLVQAFFSLMLTDTNVDTWLQSTFETHVSACKLSYSCYLFNAL